MKNPTPADCKRLAKHYGCDGVLVICVDFAAYQVAGASWGQDRERCQIMGGILDDMVDELDDQRNSADRTVGERRRG